MGVLGVNNYPESQSLAVVFGLLDERFIVFIQFIPGLRGTLLVPRSGGTEVSLVAAAGDRWHQSALLARPPQRA